MATRTRTLVVTLALLTALAGCSASDSSTGAYDEAGAVEAAPDRAASDGGSSDGPVAALDGEVATEQQQVVQTAYVTLVADDPVAAAGRVVALVDRLDGRVDARYQRSGADEDDPGYASLTVRVPSRSLTAFTSDLADVGEVREVQVDSEDVTSAAIDLDARIAATELSVARMTDLLQRATTHGDVIEAERSLTQRQAELERLRSERARLADRVALSTVEVEVHAPQRAPEAHRDDLPSFLDGLRTGWSAFTTFVRGALVLLGILLPWLVLAGVVVAVVLVTRRRRRPAATAPAHPPAAPPQPQPAAAAAPRPAPAQRADAPAPPAPQPPADA